MVLGGSDGDDTEEEEMAKCKRGESRKHDENRMTMVEQSSCRRSGTQVFNIRQTHATTIMTRFMAIVLLVVGAAVSMPSSSSAVSSAVSAQFSGGYSGTYNTNRFAEDDSANGTCYSYAVDGVHFNGCEAAVTSVAAQYAQVNFSVPLCSGRLVEVRNRLLTEGVPNVNNTEVVSTYEDSSLDAEILKKMFINGKLGCMRDCNGQCFNDNDCKIGANGT